MPGRKFSQVENVKGGKKEGRDDGKRMRKIIGGTQYKVITESVDLVCVCV